MDWVGWELGPMLKIQEYPFDSSTNWSIDLTEGFKNDSISISFFGISCSLLPVKTWTPKCNLETQTGSSPGTIFHVRLSKPIQSPEQTPLGMSALPHTLENSLIWESSLEAQKWVPGVWTSAHGRC